MALVLAWAKENGIRLPVVPGHCEQSWHMFYLIMPSLEKRQAFIDHLRECAISAVFHYLPLHLSDYARRWDGKLGDRPITKRVADRLVRLPSYFSHTNAEQESVINAVRQFKS